eukprot:1402635-Karenia_brevis.AAC.1
MTHSDPFPPRREQGRGGVPKAKLGASPNDPLQSTQQEGEGIGVGGGPRSHHPSPPQDFPILTNEHAFT